MTTPKQLIDAIENESRRKDIRTLYSQITKAVPHLKPYVSGKGIGFGTYRYQYASGRKGEAAVIGLASNAQYISVYVNGWVGKKTVTEKNARRLGKVDVGKICIRFKRVSDVELDVLVETVRAGAEAMAEMTI